MTDLESLKEMIVQYKEQLSQVEKALVVTPTGPDRDSLLSLKSDMENLIDLTRENYDCLSEPNNRVFHNAEEPVDELDEAYVLFKAEIGDIYTSETEKKTPVLNTPERTEVSLQDEFKNLEGRKCRAPFKNNYGDTEYHNAMICTVTKNDNPDDDLSKIMVKVLFLNPTCKEMLPCPYFLDGTCKFSEDQCHYSHGESVSYSIIEEYRDPNFSTIKNGSRVLAKQKNNLWHRCAILKRPCKDGDGFRVKFESSGKIEEIDVHDLLPLDAPDLETSSSSDDSENTDNEAMESERVQIVETPSLIPECTEKLGNWERHTRGIGSKLMKQMGYVRGTGLGKRLDGRIEPVEVMVLPAGKSLDHCMKLREHAGGDKNLFSAERKMRKKQKDAERMREKEYKREKQQANTNVFNLINSTLKNTVDQEENKPCSSTSKKKLEAQSSRDLNVANFQNSRNILKLEKEASKLMSSLSRHLVDSEIYKNIKTRYVACQKNLSELKSMEKDITKEQKRRKNNKESFAF